MSKFIAAISHFEGSPYLCCFPSNGLIFISHQSERAWTTFWARRWFRSKTPVYPDSGSHSGAVTAPTDFLGGSGK